MFKHLFPDKLNRLVYKGPEGPKEAIKAAESAKASSSALRKEAGDRARALDNFLNEWEVHLTTGQVGLKFNRNNPNKNYGDKLTKRDQVMYNRLSSARLQFLKLSRQPNVSRAAIDSVKQIVKGQMIIHDALRKTGDPLRNVKLSTVSNARPKVKSKAERAMARKETKERANMTKMAKLVEEFLATKRPITARRKAQIQNQLRDMASQVMGNRKRISAGGLTIEKAPGAGTEAFKFTLRQTRRLEQGRGLVRVTEKPVYAGGSAKDFPKRRA